MSSYSRPLEWLLSAGATVARGILSPAEIAGIRKQCEEISLGTYDYNNNSVSSTVLPDKPDFLHAIHRGVDVLKGLGLRDIKFLAGFVVPKRQGEMRRDWHTDSWMWEQTADVWLEIPPQVGVLFYLDAAKEDGGAPLIIPSSHRREVLGHLDYLETKIKHPTEMVCEVNAGDALVLDPRTTHASQHNLHTPNRICLTLWYLVDYNNLSEQTKATARASTIDPSFKAQLGELYPEYAGVVASKPHSKKPQFPVTFERIDALRHGKTDAEIIGAAKAPGDDFIDMHETYTWYRAVGCAIAPRNILEMGVRYGYSAIALIEGTGWAGVESVSYLGIDSEFDGIASNEIALVNIQNRRRHPFGTAIVKVSTTNVDETNAAISGHGIFDLVHIDGDHSADGILREISIAKTWVSPKGVILIDDLDIPHVRAAADKFCDDYGIQPVYLPTFHGMYVIDVRKRVIYR